MEAAKRVAYLMDATTLRVVDFTAASAAAAAGGVASGMGTVLATVSHDARIDWLVGDRTPPAGHGGRGSGITLTSSV